jgi:uncharacterized protein (DUF2141 family)
MKKHVLLITIVAASLILMAAVAVTTIDDFFLPGSQIGQSGNLETPDRCDNCHGGYDIAIEPAFNWRGSMMAQAARDPIFYACLAIANQDAPGSGDLCLRCHTPDGWLNGRCVPTDGSALNNNDRQGVQCDFCHKMVKPLQKDAGGNFIDPYPGTGYNGTVYGSNTFTQDKSYIARIIPVPGTSANGMYLADSNNGKRGPFKDATGRHQMFYSPFHQDAAHCGTCHDVSNPVFTRASTDVAEYSPNAMGAQSSTFDLRLMYPIERTYSEWQASGYAKPNDDIADKICQDCHMKDVSGKAASMKDAVFRTDMPLHDFTGGNTFAPLLVKDKWAAEVNAAALDAGIARSRAQLKAATTMEVSLTGTTVTVKITNNTGHKFPTGYPEGRRAWIQLIAYDASNNVLYQSGEYNAETATLTKEGTKIYECKPGISADVVAALNPNRPSNQQLVAGASFHMALNNTVVIDNRLPPAGYTNKKLNDYQSPAIGATYADGQNWDVTTYTVPIGTSKVEARLYYQTASKEFIEFLRDKNYTNTAGQELYALWLKHGKSAPELINSASAGDAVVTVPSLDAQFAELITRITSSKTGTYATTTVKVFSSGVAISGASVLVSFTGPTTGTLTLNTDANGLVVLNTKAVKNPLTTWCFTINNVTKTGYTYTIPKPLTRLCEGDVLKSAIIAEQPISEGIKVYPNPFSEKVRFEFVATADANAILDIFDATGRQVKTIFKGAVKNGSTYNAEFKPETQVGGMYMYRLTLGDKVYNGKVLYKK